MNGIERFGRQYPNAANRLTRLSFTGFDVCMIAYWGARLYPASPFSILAVVIITPLTVTLGIAMLLLEHNYTVRVLNIGNWSLRRWWEKALRLLVIVGGIMVVPLYPSWLDCLFLGAIIYDTIDSWRRDRRLRRLS